MEIVQRVYPKGICRPGFNNDRETINNHLVVVKTFVSIRKKKNDFELATM